MISWTGLLSYAQSKPVRAFDLLVVFSIVVGSLNGLLDRFGFSFYLPWIWHFWFIGGVANLAGVFACQALLPPEIRLHNSVERYIDARRIAAEKSNQDDKNHVVHESAIISTALFSSLGIELDGEQKKKVADHLLDHLHSASASQATHSNVLTEQWAKIDDDWSWRKALTVLLFGIGAIFYVIFLIVLLQKGWIAIRTS